MSRRPGPFASHADWRRYLTAHPAADSASPNWRRYLADYDAAREAEMAALWAKWDGDAYCAALLAACQDCGRTYRHADEADRCPCPAPGVFDADYYPRLAGVLPPAPPVGPTPC